LKGTLDSRKDDLKTSWSMTTVSLIDLLSSLDTVLLPDPGAPEIWMKSFCINRCFLLVDILYAVQRILSRDNKMNEVKSLG
jgi:hypothetical protein